jgi:flagellar export protein FliJ
MSGAIGNLIRLHRWTLDEKRRAVTELERLRERLQADVDALDAEIAAEQDAAAKTLEGAVAYPAFVAVARQRRDKLVESLQAVEQETEQARETVQQAFEELKKYELAEANAARRLKAKRQRAERQAEDDLGLDLHRRKGG